MVVLQCDVEVASWALPVGAPDLAFVDALARLELAVRRLGCSVRLRGAHPELLELLELSGLQWLVHADLHGFPRDEGGRGRSSDR